MMMWLKACPRCRGDLFLDSDYYGPSANCIQCGYTLQEPLPGVQPSRLEDRLPATAPLATMTLSVSASEQQVKVA